MSALGRPSHSAAWLILAARIFHAAGLVLASRIFQAAVLVLATRMVLAAEVANITLARFRLLRSRLETSLHRAYTRNHEIAFFLISLDVNLPNIIGARVFETFLISLDVNSPSIAKV